MKRMSLLVGGVITAAMLVQPTLAISTYTFDSDEESWETGNFYRYEGSKSNVFGFYENMDATHEANGPSGGYIQRAYDKSTDGNKYLNYKYNGVAYPYKGVAYSLVVKGDEAESLDSKLGDLTGRSLQADVYSNGEWENNTHARWFIGKYQFDSSDTYTGSDFFISKYSESINLDRDGWETESIGMKEENFFRWPNQAANGDFEDVLYDYNEIGIQLFADTSDEWNARIAEERYGAVNAEGGESAVVGLDNLASVPSPTALGGGVLLMGMLALRRRRGV